MKQQLNLIDPKLLPKAARPSVVELVSILAVASVAVLGHYSWEHARFVAVLAQPGTGQAAAAPDEGASDAALETLQRQVERDELLRDGLARASDLPADSATQLRQLASALPDTLWLTDVELSGRTGLRIAGGAQDVAALTIYAARLGEIASLKGRPLQALMVEPQRTESRGDSEASTAESRPSHHLFVLASGDPQTSIKDTR